MKVQAGMGFLGATLSGCAAAPSINVLGAYFPGWMFCIVGAIVTSSIVHLILRALGRVGGQDQGGLPLAYSLLTVVFALAGWILFFKN